MQYRFLHNILFEFIASASIQFCCNVLLGGRTLITAAWQDKKELFFTVFFCFGQVVVEKYLFICGRVFFLCYTKFKGPG
jgi:hypothetical protein